MPFQIIKGDLLTLACDAIVNPTDEICSGSGGLDAQIHRAAGPELAAACSRLIPLEAGSAAATPGYRLKSRYVIHTVAPWRNGESGECSLLRSCYRTALRTAAGLGCQRIALPLIGSGTRGFSKELVLRIAAEEIGSWLRVQEDAAILLVIYDRNEFQPDPALLAGLDNYILSVREDEDAEPAAGFPDESSVLGASRPEKAPEPCAPIQPGSDTLAYTVPAPKAKRLIFSQRSRDASAAPQIREESDASPAYSQTFFDFTLPRELVLDESFSQMVLRKIDERGFRKDSECYTRANMDRRLFSRIRCDEHYHPKKTTALALAVALELSLSETKELLGKAGYSLSHSILFDIIVEYCILNGNYDIIQINELLFQYDQPLLGG